MAKPQKPNGLGTGKCMAPLCDREIEWRRNKNGELYYHCPGLYSQVGCRARMNLGDQADPADIPGFRSYKDDDDPRDDGDGGAAAAAPVTLRKDEAAVDPIPNRNVTESATVETEGWGIDF